MFPSPAVACQAFAAPRPDRPLGSVYPAILLAQARHDDLMRTAARSRIAAQIRRSRGPWRYRLIAGPVRRLVGIRRHKVAGRLAAS